MNHPAHELSTDAYRKLSPFEQIPAIDDDGIALSESAGLPRKEGAQADLRRPRRFVEWAHRHLASLERWLDGREFVATGTFTVADILMSLVLSGVNDDSLLKPYDRVRDYRERCKSRPAWRRTIEAYCARVEAA